MIVYRKLIIILVVCLLVLAFTSADAASPIGFLDLANCDTVSGWAGDPDAPSSEIMVHVYVNGPAGVGTQLATVSTNIYRPDVNAQFGVTGNHGFGGPVPEFLKDGTPHSIYVYAIDSGGNGPNPLIGGSPKTITCGAPQGDTPRPTVSSVSPNLFSNSVGITLNVYGSNFVNGVKIVGQMGSGAPVATNADFINSSNLRLNIAKDTLAGGKYSVWVRNPDGDISNKQTITVSPTRIGILYSVFHCPVSDSPRALEPIYTVSEALAGEEPWADVGNMYWSAEPQDGYYCLIDDIDVLLKHATMLKDAGIDFVIIDSTSFAYTGQDDWFVNISILDPFDKLVEVWSEIPGAPRIVPWAPAPSRDLYGGRLVIDHMMEKLEESQNRHLLFYYDGKPLVLVASDTTVLPFAPNYATLRGLREKYTVRVMWGANPARDDLDWYYIAPCQSSFRLNQGFTECNQASSPSQSGGMTEHIPIANAYVFTYASDKTTATPKYAGRTFQRQFEKIFSSPLTPVATIAVFNNFLNSRACLDVDGHFTIDPSECVTTQYEDGSKIFWDAYDAEFSHYIEPTAGIEGDYYYQLLKSCVLQFKKDGTKCQATFTDPVLTHVYPLSVPPNWSGNIYFHGVNFKPGSTLLINNQDVLPLAEYVRGSVMKLSVTPEMSSSSGVHTIRIKNPNGVTSNEITFEITDTLNPTPTPASESSGVGP
jgi:hypothetical protein